MVINLVEQHPRINHINEILELGGIIAGGYARYMATDRSSANVIEYGDIDIFVPNYVEYNAVYNYLGTFDDFPSDSYGQTVFDIDNVQFNLIKPDIFREFYTVTGLIEEFDFTICQVALDKFGLWATADFYIDNLGDVLRFNPEYEIKDPILSMKRIIKYAKKGYEVKPELIKQVLEAWEGGAKVEHNGSTVGYGG